MSEHSQPGHIAIPSPKRIIWFIIGFIIGVFLGGIIIIFLLSLFGLLFQSSATMIQSYPIYTIPILLLVFYFIWKKFGVARMVALGIIIGFFVSWALGYILAFPEITLPDLTEAPETVNQILMPIKCLIVGGIQNVIR